jgi:hypothetical protein
MDGWMDGWVWEGERMNACVHGKVGRWEVLKGK